MNKPLTSAVFIAEARDSTMWTVLWTMWTSLNVISQKNAVVFLAFRDLFCNFVNAMNKENMNVLE